MVFPQIEKVHQSTSTLGFCVELKEATMPTKAGSSTFDELSRILTSREGNFRRGAEGHRTPFRLEIGLEGPSEVS